VTLRQTADRAAPHLLSLLRIMSALLLYQHAFSKFFGWPVAGMTPETFTLIWFAGVIELVGATLLLLGLCTRAAAFILSGELAFAYFIAHAPNGFYPLANRGEGAVLFCFIFLYIAAAGAGPWSLDARLRKA